MYLKMMILVDLWWGQPQKSHITYLCDTNLQDGPEKYKAFKGQLIKET